MVSACLKGGVWRVQNKRLTNKHQGVGWSQSISVVDACALGGGLRSPQVSRAANEEESECEAEESGDKLAPTSLTPMM